MRISDWSSDVCSSDLEPAEIVHCRRRARRHQQHRQRRRDRPHHPLPSPAPYHAPAPIAMDSAAPAPYNPTIPVEPRLHWPVESGINRDPLTLIRIITAEGGSGLEGGRGGEECVSKGR